MKRTIVWLLVLALMLGLMPIGALAAEEPGEAPTEVLAEEPTEVLAETLAEEPTEVQAEEPTKVPAETQPEEKESSTHQMGFHVNPLYEDVYTEADFVMDTAEEEQPEAAESSDDSDLSGEPEEFYAATYVTSANAAPQLRKYMKARTKSFDLYVKTSSSDYEAVFEKVMTLALAHTGDPKEGDYLMWQYGGWSGQVEESYSNEVYKFHYTITMTYYTTAAQEKELDTAVTKLLKTLNVGSKSDYQKVCAVYDYIRDNVTYDYDHLEDTSYMLKHTAYAALVKKTAVCQGYATLLYRLLLELDVDNRVIVGEANGGGHAWNIIKLDDVYYNADATWDSIQGGHDYFLRNSLSFADHLRYLDYATTQFHTDYPISETDYVKGVAGKPEYYFVIGVCGDDAYWAIDRDKQLTITGTGAIADFELDTEDVYHTLAPWWYWNDGINKVIIEEGITQIGANAFYDMDNMSSLVLPKTLQIICDSAFGDCDGLTKIKFPSSLETIEEYAFCDCSALTQVTIPGSVKIIARSAFSYCRKMNKVTLEEGVECIERNAFEKTAITSIVIPGSVRTLEHAFYDCYDLETVKVEAPVEKIGDGAFTYCTALTKVELQEGLKIIDTAAFQKCISLPEITIPASVTEIDTSAFSRCDSMKKITFCGDAPKFADSVFGGVTATAYYPDNSDSWTEDVMQDYGGDITWVSYHVHDYDDAVPVFNAETKTHSWDCAGCDVKKTEKCTFDEVILEEATLEAPGMKKHTCSVCGGSYEAPYIYRVSGADRVGTALAAADLLKQTLGVEKFDSIILADGYNFADALPGSYLAAKKNAPILLHHKRGVDRNEAYIRQNLSADGVFYILGGTVAVPASVETSLTAQGYRVVRLAGNTRYDTNLEILKEAGVTNEEILVCTGGDFADSLSASATGLPILLTNYKTGKLTNKQIAFLSDDCANNFTIIGGTKAVSAEIEEQLRSYGEVVRLSGATRYHSSVLVAERFFADPDKATVASGKDFPDGLCGGPLAYNLKAPLLLVDRSKESIAAKYITGNGITGGAILGGPAVVSDASGRIAFGLQ